jgi:hypothetical protein
MHWVRRSGSQAATGSRTVNPRALRPSAGWLGRGWVRRRRTGPALLCADHPAPVEVDVDLTFLDSAAEREERRRQAVAKALRYAQRASALTDELLSQREGQAWPRSPEGERAGSLAASAACQAWAAVARLLDPRAWQEP